ncbi:hypothetical protein B0H14DRAFT_3515731 [Mycena olivaceomarginata]|nr:hypothetical protein B0H14DRAFT_3515731 [Mycena olivaceomarginata]
MLRTGAIHWVNMTKTQHQELVAGHNAKRAVSGSLKKHAERSDKGVPCGPREKTAVTKDTSLTSALLTTSALPTTSASLSTSHGVDNDGQQLPTTAVEATRNACGRGWHCPHDRTVPEHATASLGIDDLPPLPDSGRQVSFAGPDPFAFAPNFASTLSLDGVAPNFAAVDPSATPSQTAGVAMQGGAAPPMSMSEPAFAISAQPGGVEMPRAAPLTTVFSASGSTGADPGSGVNSPTAPAKRARKTRSDAGVSRGGQNTTPVR